MALGEVRFLEAGQLVQEHRKKAGYGSLALFAAPLNISKTHVADVEAGRLGPSSTLAHQMFELIAMPVNLREKCVDIWADGVFTASEEWDCVAVGKDPKLAEA